MPRAKKVKVEVEEEAVIVPEVAKEVEMYNGKKVVSSKDVEINDKKYKEITTEDGSTYVI